MITWVLSLNLTPSASSSFLCMSCPPNAKPVATLPSIVTTL